MSSSNYGTGVSGVRSSARSSAVGGSYASSGLVGDQEEEGRAEFSESRSVSKLIPDMRYLKTEDAMEEGDDEKMSEASGWSSVNTGSERRKPGRTSKDEEIARHYGLPFSAEEISFMPLQEFQNALKSNQLTSVQKDAMQKIRRRGKNKMAARNCRERRTTNLVQLGTETELLEQEREHEIATFHTLRGEIAKERAALARLEQERL